MELKNIFFKITFKPEIFLRMGPDKSFEPSFLSSKASFSNFKLITNLSFCFCKNCSKQFVAIEEILTQQDSCRVV